MEQEILQKILDVVNKDTNNMEIWIPAVISIVTLIINLSFYIFIQPRLTYKATAKDNLAKISVAFLNYLSEIISYDSFEGVLTEIRKYSLQIHLQFKDGTADGQLEILLEKIYQEVKKRKGLTELDEIDMWNKDFRVTVRELRKLLSKYCGAL